jgi:hypothetical protein
MTKMLTQAEAKAYEETDTESLIPAGDYKVKITSIEAKEGKPETKCFKFKVMSGDYARRQLRAWPSTAPDLIWTLKKLIGEVVVDPIQLQLEDLEGHIFKASVTIEPRKDNGESTNRVVRLTPWDGGTESVPWDGEDYDY